MSIIRRLRNFFVTDLEVVFSHGGESPLSLKKLDMGNGAILCEENATTARHIFFGGVLPTRGLITLIDLDGTELTVRRGRLGKIDVTVIAKGALKPVHRIHFLAIDERIAIKDLCGAPVRIRRFRHREFRYDS